MQPRSIRALLLACLLILPFSVGAEQVVGVDPIVLTVTPQYPRPYETVRIGISSTVLDLAGSSVTIAANGTKIGEGSGDLSALATTGAAGTRTSITATVVSGGQTYTKTLAIVPVDVSLVVESGTRAHPLYAGAALPAADDEIRIVALTDMRTTGGGRLSPASLTYTWKFGDQTLVQNSGIGKSVLRARGPLRYRNAAVSVTVTNADQTLVGGAEMTITPMSPAVRIYRNDPLLGPDFENAIGSNVRMDGTEETFRAVPYYFPSLPNLSWTVNGLENGQEADLTLRSTGSGAGTASIGIDASLPNSLLTAAQSMTVSFGASQSLGIFGL